MRTKQLKYVIIDDCGTERAILFDANISHLDVYDKLKIISAGFCILRYDDRFQKGLIIEASGESESLKIKSRENDKDIIYKSMIIGPWDYGILPEDPLHDELDKRIKEKERLDLLHE